MSETRPLSPPPLGEGGAERREGVFVPSAVSPKRGDKGGSNAKAKASHSMDNSAKARGDIGEDIDAQYLAERGFQILSRQWRCRYGELDLIARDSSGMVHFVEVKLRKRGGVPGREAVDARKRERLRKAALCWLSENAPDAVARFDVAEIQADPDGLFRLDYIPDAFA